MIWIQIPMQAFYLEPFSGLHPMGHWRHHDVSRLNRGTKASVSNHTSTKSWRGNIFTPVCLCVCVCVCVCMSVCMSGFLMNKISAERMHRLGHGFC